MLPFAADVTDALAGSAGWVGAGLLGGVLSWLMFIRLPANDKMIKELVDAKDKQMNIMLKDKDNQMMVVLDHKWEAIKALSSDHKEAIKSLAGEFRAVVQEVSQHCDKEVERLVRAIETQQKPQILTK